MSHNTLNIKEGAFFISDAHFSPSRPQLLEFLKAIKLNELQATQLILMGDIFDALFGGVPRTYVANQEVIDLINDISLSIEVIYLEGNHDFNLKKVFTKSRVFTIEQQPVLCQLDDKIIYLAHGDIDGKTSYKFYTFFARNKIVLFLLNIINTVFNDIILTRLQNHLSKKQDCTEIKNFTNIIKNKLENKYKCEYFLEGHFHQNKHIKFDNLNYFNLAAFACNQRYFIVKSSNEELFVENTFSKGT